MPVRDGQEFQPKAFCERSKPVNRQTGSHSCDWAGVVQFPVTRFTESGRLFIDKSNRSNYVFSGQGEESSGHLARLSELQVTLYSPRIPDGEGNRYSNGLVDVNSAGWQLQGQK